MLNNILAKLFKKHNESKISEEYIEELNDRYFESMKRQSKIKKLYVDLEHNKDDYKKCFEITSKIAELNDVDNNKILTNKEEIDEYFIG